jgi:hypothetical protein
MLIKIGLLSARWGLTVVVHSMVGTSAALLECGALLAHIRYLPQQTEMRRSPGTNGEELRLTS